MAFTRRDLTELVRLLTGSRRTRLPAWLRPVVSALRGNPARLPPQARQFVEAVQQAERENLLPRPSVPFTEALQTPGQPPSAAPPTTDQDPAPVPPKIHPRTRVPQGFPEEQQNFSEEFLTPASSNVYSFQYYRQPGDSGLPNQTRAILYVTYKANRIRSSTSPTSGMFGTTRRHRGRKGQVYGEHGSTVGSKTNGPGSTYAYFDVPLSVFHGMKGAYSKGHYVWEKLRVEHSVWGHRYKYQLIVGQVLGTPAGGQYVPRKATRKGYVTRAVADIGTGRRGFVTSTLPAPHTGSGFSTFRARGSR
jgi:hypothetical protein